MRFAGTFAGTFFAENLNQRLMTGGWALPSLVTVLCVRLTGYVFRHGFKYSLCWSCLHLGISKSTLLHRFFPKP
jgi:hypothetical protein